MGKFIVEIEQVGKRLDLFVISVIKDLSRMNAKRLIEDGNVKVNSKNSKVSYKVQNGDIIEIHIPEAKQLDLKAQEIPIEVAYEDSDIML